jgi:hypothetical protein
MPLGTTFNCSNTVEVDLEGTVVDPEGTVETVGARLGLGGAGRLIVEETAGGRLGLVVVEETAGAVIDDPEEGTDAVEGDTIIFVPVVAFDCSVFFFGKR